MRFFYCAVIIIAAILLPWWAAAILWVWYAFVFRAYELVVLGILLDAYFGYVFPWHLFYTLVATLICFGAELVKPRIAIDGIGRW